MLYVDVRQVRVRLVLHDDLVGAAVAARAQQLKAHVAVQRALVDVRVARGAVRGHHHAAILIAHMALGVVVGGLGVVADRVGAQQLVEAGELGFALEEIVLGVGAADAVGVRVGRDFGTVALGRQTRDIDVEQVALLAHRPVDRLLRALDHAERAARRRRIVRLRDAARQEEAERRNEAAHRTRHLGHGNRFVGTRGSLACRKLRPGGKPEGTQAPLQRRSRSLAPPMPRSIGL